MKFYIKSIKKKKMMQLHVRVVEATNIAKMDLVKSDPYCIVSVPESNSTQRTRVIQNSLTPKWNEVFHFSISNPSSATLHIEMKDEDVIKDDKMATLSIQVCSLPPGQVVDQWYNMTPASGVKKGGNLHLVLHLAPQGAPAFVPQMMQQPQAPYPGAYPPGAYPGGYPPGAFPGQQPGYPPQQQPAYPGYGQPGAMMSFAPPPRPPGMKDKDYKKLLKAQKKMMKKAMKGKY